MLLLVDTCTPARSWLIFVDVYNFSVSPSFCFETFFHTSLISGYIYVYVSNENAPFEFWRKYTGFPIVNLCHFINKDHSALLICEEFTEINSYRYIFLLALNEILACKQKEDIITGLSHHVFPHTFVSQVP